MRVVVWTGSAAGGVSEVMEVAHTPRVPERRVSGGGAGDVRGVGWPSSERML